VVAGFPNSNGSKPGSFQRVKTSKGLPGGGYGQERAVMRDKTELAKPGYPDNGGSAARFFYCPKASRSDRNSGLDSTEHVSIMCSWENEDHEVRLRVDTEASPPRVIGASTAGSNDATSWSMLLFGSEIAVPFHPECRFIISTGTNSTTKSPTLNWLTRSRTSGCTAGANCETESGTSHAACAGTFIQWVVNTGTCPQKDGRNTDAASGVTFEWLLQRSRSVSVTDARPYSSSHPTVKPTDLMAYLCRLVTPKGGIVLDPFCGSGSTGKAAVREGFDFLGIELDPEYAGIARSRIEAEAEKSHLYQESAI
jgi:hypothetical protein